MRAHVDGDGHAKSHKLLAQLNASFVNANNSKPGKPVTADDFLTWVPRPAAKTFKTRAEWRAYQRELKKKNASG